jgi:molybdate transport system substrate-binding protein
MGHAIKISIGVNLDRSYAHGTGLITGGNHAYRCVQFAAHRQGPMTSGTASPLRAGLAICLAVFGVLYVAPAMAGVLEVFHADSLAGPLGEIKKAFEAKHPGVTVNLTSGTSKQLAQRILNGDPCDVFASSSPMVIDQDLMNKPVAGSSQAAASWYVIFSANEMVVITAKGNPLGIRHVSDLAEPGVKFIRVTGEKDLATGRTVEFLKRAAALEGKPALAQKIIDGAPIDPSKPVTVSDVVNAVRGGQASAGVDYFSAAIAAQNDIAIIRFPASVNMGDEIRNAATVPGTAKNPKEATALVRFLLTVQARAILKKTGQPPVVPAIRKGDVPADVIN